MAKKQFFITISLSPKDKLNATIYEPEFRKGFIPMKTTAPGMTLIEMFLEPGDDYEIVAIMTDDVEGKSAANFETFKKELEKLSEKKKMDIRVTKEIHVSFEESKKKHIEFFRNICDSFEPLSEIYMDVTYGTKITSISQFSSLVYAEKVLRCSIREVVYGLFDTKNSKIGKNNQLFSVRCVYELKELIQSASMLDGIDIDELLDKFEGKANE